MGYKFSFRPHSQRFTHPVITNHGVWEIRDCIIVHLIDEQGTSGWGEIAPISWFGSETLAAALDFCHQLPTEITEETIFSIPDSLPACQFGFESAREGLGGNPYQCTHLPYSALLPAGAAALNQWQPLWEQGYRTFKWKIGVQAIAQELEIFHHLIHQLPDATQLRLDANGGLSYEDTRLWLERCENCPRNIEFMEQPLGVEEFSQMLALSQSYNVAIALDESVSTLKQLESCHRQGWQGIFVIKPGIIGSPSRLREFCHAYQLDLVFSSVFETSVGRQAALQLAAELSPPHRAVGFGINYFWM
jgi:O-succinylbenzoate synthase